MAATSLSEVPGEPGWVLFEKRCWKTAREKFMKNISGSNVKQAKVFLARQGSVDDAKSACQKVERDSSERYSTEKSFSISIAHKKVVPKSLLVKLMGNLDTFTKAGDAAFAGGPETVGAVWVGVKFALNLVKSDFEACQLLTSCFADIVGIFISCRLYAKLYGDSVLTGGLPEIQEQVREMIPNVLQDILGFSFSATKFVDQAEPERWIKEVFRSSKVKFESKASAIRSHHAKLISRAEQAALEESTIRGRNDSAELASIKEMLIKVKEQYDEEKKYLKKVTFADVVRIDFEENIKTLNPNVDIKALYKRNLDLCEDGTCQWIFAGDMVEYQTWRQSKTSQILGVTGEAGFGKSVLLSSIIAQLEAEFLPEKEEAEQASVLVQYFFCRFGNDATQLQNSILDNLVYQLYNAASSSPKLLEECNNYFKECNNYFKERNTTRGAKADASLKSVDCVDIYTKFARTLDKQIYLIVDALDECSDNPGAGLLEIFQKMIESSNIKLKILISARPNTTLQRALKMPNCQEIQIKEHNGPDIRHKVEKGLESVTVLTEEERKVAKDKIADKAEGEFNYVDTAISVLRQPWQRFVAGKQRSLGDILEELPPGMRGSYKLAFEQIEPLYLDLAKTCLIWALLSEGEIKVTEVMDAYTGAFSSSSYSVVQQELTKRQLDTIADQIGKATGPFLEIDTKSKMWTIKLRHASVKDYFLKKESPAEEPVAMAQQLCAKCNTQIETKSAFFVYEKQGHLTMAITILRNLNSPLFQKTYFKIEEMEDEEAKEEEVEEEARDDDEIKQEKENEKGESNEGDTQNEDPAESSGPAVAEVVASPTEPMQETSEHNSDEAAHPTEDAEKNAEEGNEEDGAPGAEGEGRVDQDNNDTVGDFIDNEDDFEVPQDGPQAEGPGSWASEPDLRYEITHWFYHVREAEKRWTKEEMKENSEWKELWDLLEQFLFRTPKAFKAWRRIYWWTADNLPLHFWYNDVGPMHVAAAFGLTRFIENIIQKGYSISERTSMNEIPLHLASKSTQVDKELLEILLKTDPQPNFMTETWVRPPFHTVLTTAQPFEVVELFLHYGANCTMKDNRGDSCLHLYAYWGQDLRILDLLLAKGANINAKDGAGETPLHRLLQKLEPPIEMIREFLKAGADIGMEDNYSQQPLYEAALAGNLDAAKALLANDPNPDITDQDFLGMTAIHIAAYNGHQGIVELLHQHGAPLNEPDHHGRTPLYLACQGRNADSGMYILRNMTNVPFEEINHPDKDGRTPLRKAVRHGLLDVLPLILERVTEVEVLDRKDKKSGRSATHVAAANGHKEALGLLLDKGANIDLLDSDGKTALQLCHEGWVRGNRNAIEATIVLLVERSSQEAVEDQKLLFTAARKGSTVVLQALLDRRVNIDMKDHHGWTALVIARQYGHKAADELLTKAGAEIRTRPTRFLGNDERVRVSDTGLEVEFVDEDYKHVSVLTDHPIPALAKDYYFEVEVKGNVGKSENPRLGIGLATDSVKLVGQMPGWQSASPWWGYHGDDGWLFRYDSRPIQLPGYLPYGRGDVVGCGIDFTSRTLFYTINGVKLGNAFEGVNGQLFPVIGMGEKVAVEVNFGERPFKWVKAQNLDP